MLLRSHLRPVASALGLIVAAVGACARGVAPVITATSGTHPTDSVATPEMPRRLAGEDAATYMRRASAAGFSGEVLAAIGDSVVLSAAYGIAIPATRTPYDNATPTYIGSLTKQFTAAAILKLAEEGKLTVRDSIGKFISGVPADKMGVTIERLLTHTAGIPDTIGERYGSQFLSRAEFLRRLLAAPLDPAPHTFSYSTSGYALLAVIIELASGQRYEDYLKQHLFRPARLTRTGYVLAPRLMRQAAHARLGSEDLGAPQSRKTWTPDGPTWALRGGGGMLSTATDLFRWYRALRTGAVLSRQFAAPLFEPLVAEDSTRTSFYGYGWFVVPQTSHGKAIGHNGSDGIYYATLVSFADQDVVVILLTNSQPPGLRRIESGITAAVFDAIAASRKVQKR